MSGGLGEGSVRPQLALKADEPSRDTPAALKKSLRVSFLLPTAFSASIRPSGRVAAPMSLLGVSFVVASFLLVVLPLLEVGGVVNLPPRLSAILLCTSSIISPSSP